MAASLRPLVWVIDRREMPPPPAPTEGGWRVDPGTARDNGFANFKIRIGVIFSGPGGGGILTLRYMGVAWKSMTLEDLVPPNMRAWRCCQAFSDKLSNYLISRSTSWHYPTYKSAIFPSPKRAKFVDNNQEISAGSQPG